MPVQTSYTANHSALFEGQRVNLGLTNVTSKVAQSSDIPFGRAVVRGTADDQCVLPSATGQAFLGVTEHTTAWSENASDLHVYSQYRECNIIDFGLVAVYTEQSVVPGDSVYFRHTAAANPLDVVGRFRKDSSGGDADQVIGATFESTTAAGGIAIIKINHPGVGVSVAPDSSETITTSGAIALTTTITYFDSTAGAIAATLADGVEGQIKRLVFDTDGGDVVITPANLALGSTLRMTEIGSVIDLQFSDTSWKVVNTQGKAIVEVTATSGALALDADLILFDTTLGASTSTLADGYPGQEVTLKMTVDGGNQVLTPANLLDGTTITFDDAGDSAHLIFADGNWNVVGTATATVA